MQKCLFSIYPWLLLISVLLSSCTILEVYQPKIQQGNVLDAQQLAQLKLGMSKNEVKQLLGSPVIANIFYQDVWEYVNVSSEQNYRLKLVFENGQLKQIIPTNLPSTIGPNKDKQLLPKK